MNRHPELAHQTYFMKKNLNMITSRGILEKEMTK